MNSPTLLRSANPAQVEQFTAMAKRELDAHRAEMSLKYNLNFLTERPKQGRYAWTAMPEEEKVAPPGLGTASRAAGGEVRFARRVQSLGRRESGTDMQNETFQLRTRSAKIRKSKSMK